MRLFKQRRSEFWYVDYYDENGRRHRHSTQTADKREALRQSRLIQAEIARGRSMGRLKAITIKEMLDNYVRWAYEQGRSYRRADQSRAHILEHTNGQLSAARIKLHHIEHFQKMRLAEGAAPGTVKREITVLIASLNHALRDGLIPANPLAGRVRHIKTQPRVRLLSKDERERLLIAAKAGPPHLYRIIVLLLTTGLRRNECLMLRWDDIDFEKKVLFVRKGKGGKSRMVPLGQQAIILLESLPRLGEYVTTDENGNRISSVKRSFRTACRRAGIEDLWLHDLRRSFASELAMRGVSPFVIQTLLGHSQLKTTEIYVQLSESALRTAVNQVPELGIDRRTNRHTELGDDVRLA